jgi:hypothetical protein
VGEFALHVGCPWRLVGPAGELLACDESGPEVLAGLASPLFCSGVRVGTDGAFDLAFVGVETLVVEPDDRSCEEFWRLFRPASEQPHLVVGSGGIDPTG